MARTVPSSVTDAITIPESIRETGRLTAYKSRTYFDVYVDNAPDYALPIPDPGAPHSSAYPLPEAISYNTELGKFITIAVKPSGEIALQVEGEEAPVILGTDEAPIVASATCRPGILENSFWYYSPEETMSNPGSWRKVVFDPTLVLDGTADCIESETEYSTRPNGAIYPLSNSEAVIFHIDDGGIRPVFIASDGSEHQHPGRLFNPTHAFSIDDTDDLITLQFSGATIFDNNVFVYMTMYNGSVKVAKYKIATDTINGSWSDYLVAVPEDISVFEVGNVFTYNSRVFMCGKFYRKEEFETTTKYTLLLWSDDGYTFSIDRKTLVSAVDLRFLAAMEESYLTFSSSNRYSSSQAPYQLVGENAESVEITINNISGASQSGWSAKVRASDEVYLDNPLLETGVYAKFEVGVHTINGVEWIKYHDVVISQITQTFEDGVRGHTVNIVPDALWHTSMMTHPFYMEVQGKQSVLDTVQVLDNLYKVESGSGGIPWSLSCDFWTKEITESAQGGFIYQTHAAAIETDWWCPDIKEFADDYPVLGSDANIEVRVYGWSRAGIPSGAPAPNPVDDTPTSTPNDDFYALMLVEDTDGNQSTVVSLVSELTSDHANPPQSWFVEGAREGSYPVIWAIANPGEGKKIIKVGCRVIANTGNTTYNLERMELPGIVVTYLPVGSADPGAELVEIPSPGTDTGFNIRAGDSQNPPPNLPDPDTNYTTYTQTIGPATANTLGNGSGVIWRINNPTGEDMAIKVTLRARYTYSGPAEYTGVSIYPPCMSFEPFAYLDTFGNPETVAGFDTTIVRQGTIGAVGAFIFGLWWISSHKTDLSITFDMTIEIPGEPPAESPVTSKSLQITKKGKPTVYFSQRPFSTWNFDCITRTSFVGEYALSGLLGIASDDNNYVVGYIENGKIGIGVVRAGVKTTLVDVADAGIVPETTYDVRFWHRDGLFGVETKAITDTAWPTRGSQLTYSWLDTDGPMATIDDIFHVGLFTFINPPKFRTTSYRSSGTIVPVLPLDINPETGTSDLMTKFPYAGKIDIDGTIFNYTGITPWFTSVSTPYKQPLGPYQLRSIGDVQPPYSNDPNGVVPHHHYSAGKCITILQFEWRDGDDSGLFAGAAIGGTAGGAFYCNDTQWKVWITTSKKLVWIRERARHYVEDAYANLLDGFGSNGLSTKVYITNSLDGVSLNEEIDSEFSYEAGTFVYLDNDDKIDVFGFYAVSGDPDQNLVSLLRKFCQTAGTSASFPGDLVFYDETVASDEGITLQ